MRDTSSRRTGNTVTEEEEGWGVFEATIGKDSLGLIMSETATPQISLARRAERA